MLSKIVPFFYSFFHIKWYGTDSNSDIDSMIDRLHNVFKKKRIPFVFTDYL